MGERGRSAMMTVVACKLVVIGWLGSDRRHLLICVYFQTEFTKRGDLSMQGLEGTDHMGTSPLKVGTSSTMANDGSSNSLRRIG
jgi:hypothetical protein